MKSQVSTQEEHDDLMKEVLEEEKEHYDQYYGAYEEQASSSHEKLQQQEADAEHRRKEEEERVAREESDRIAKAREEAFEAELRKMNEEQQKAAMRQKRRDAKIVKSVLKSAKSNKLYSVLGIRNWKLRIPAREFSIFKHNVTIPGMSLKETSSKDIRKAYRVRALAVHPDKNRDGNAEEAFVAVENAASILSDEKMRATYDEEIRLLVQQRNREIQRQVIAAIDSARQVFSQTVSVFRFVFGPFATPVLIIGTLLI